MCGGVPRAKTPCTIYTVALLLALALALVAPSLCLHPQTSRRTLGSAAPPDVQRSVINCRALSPAAALVGCCADRRNVSLAGVGVAGALPLDFRLATHFSDLSDNPELCGVIKELPEPVKGAQAWAPPLNITNTSIQLDLPAAGAADEVLAPKVAMWLGVGAMSGGNLLGMLPEAQLYHICTLFDKGRITVLGTNYCAAGRDPNCSCAALAQTSSVFARKRDWDACHVTLLDVSFDAPASEAAALAMYNRHVMSSASQTLRALDVAAFACGDDGKVYRLKVAGVFMGGTLGVFLLSAVVVYSWRRRYGSLPQSRQHWLWGIFMTIVHLGLQVYDVVSDWVSMFEVADAGNSQALLLLGWLMTAPYVVLAMLPALLAGWSCMSTPKRRAMGVLMTAFALALMLAAFTTLGIATGNLQRFGGDGSVASPGDCRFLTKLFLSFTMLGQAALVLFANFLRVTVVGKEQPHRDVLDCMEVSDALFLFIEDVPQLVTQNVLWVDGQSMLSTGSYVQSVVTSLASICFRLVFWYARPRASEPGDEHAGAVAPAVPQASHLITCPSCGCQHQLDAQPGGVFGASDSGRSLANSMSARFRSLSGRLLGRPSSDGSSADAAHQHAHAADKVFDDHEGSGRGRDQCG